MANLLIQSKASKADADPLDQQVGGNGDSPFADYFLRDGIRPLKETLIDSCHGCSVKNRQNALDAKQLAESDAFHKVVCMEYGGLLFGKPSIDAANSIHVPVISIPSDDVAFMASYVPTGNAVCASVGIDDFQTAAYFAREMFIGQFEGVHTYRGSDKTLAALEKYGIRHLGETKRHVDGIVICEIPTEAVKVDLGGQEETKHVFNHNCLAEADNLGDICLYTVDGADLKGSGDVAFMMAGLIPAAQNLSRSAYTRGGANAALYAAKIIALNDSGMQRDLAKMHGNKVKSYGVRDAITLDKFMEPIGGN